VATHLSPSVYDGTTGGSDHGGRRTHIIQILRDARQPMSVSDIATMVGIHVNTARFHLESLVDAGLATRAPEVRQAPGRRRILYTGTLPNQTHERAQGYRLLAEILTAAIASKYPDVGGDMHEVGAEWGRYLTTKPAPYETFDESDIADRVVDKLDALWFAPEMRREPSPEMLLHNCPFIRSAMHAPQVVCQLHAGMINGSLEELRSSYRVTEMWPQEEPHLCRARLTVTGDAPLRRVVLHAPPESHREAARESTPV